jgi:hypothetical protein
MRVTINPTFDMVSMTWLARPSYEYFGPIWDFKGDKTAQSAEQTQAAFDQQLMNIFTQQYGKQSQVFNFLTGKMQSMIAAGGQGYDPGALTAMRTSATDVNAQQTKNAQQAFANSVSARSGGSKLAGVSGAEASGEAAIAAEGAANEANSQNAITLANEQLRQQNYWNATNVLSGQEAVANPLGYSAGATSGTNAVSNASQAVTAAQGPSALQIVGGIVGGGLAAAAGPGGALTKLV